MQIGCRQPSPTGAAVTLVLAKLVLVPELSIYLWPIGPIHRMLPQQPHMYCYYYYSPTTPQTVLFPPNHPPSSITRRLSSSSDDDDDDDAVPASPAATLLQPKPDAQCCSLGWAPRRA
jgi:hypothetical protein